MNQEEYRPEPSTEQTVHEQLIAENIIRRIIHEGLLRSFPDDIIKRWLHEKYRYHNPNERVFLITFQTTPNIGDNQSRYDELKNFMENAAVWFHGSTRQGLHDLDNKMDFIEMNNNEIIILQYEPKFDIEVSSQRKPGILYHLTLERKLDKILEMGLTPKTSTHLFNFNNRIYLSENIESLYDLAERKLQINVNLMGNNPIDDDLRKFAILRVRFGSRQRLFIDPKFENGYYTFENIDRSAIRVVEKFDIDVNGHMIHNQI